MNFPVTPTLILAADALVLCTIALLPALWRDRGRP